MFNSLYNYHCKIDVPLPPQTGRPAPGPVTLCWSWVRASGLRLRITPSATTSRSTSTLAVTTTSQVGWWEFINRTKIEHWKYIFLRHALCFSANFWPLFSRTPHPDLCPPGPRGHIWDQQGGLRRAGRVWDRSQGCGVQLWLCQVRGHLEDS